MKISLLTPQPYRPGRSPRFGQDDAAQPPVRRPLSLGLTVLQDPPPHDHQTDGPGVKPCCAGKLKSGPTGLSLTVLNDTPDPSRPQNAGGNPLTVLTPPTHKPGGSCCGGHKQDKPVLPVAPANGGSCCGTKPGNHTSHEQAAPAPTTLPGKIVHAVKSVLTWFGHFFGSFLADLKLLVSGKSQ